MSDDTRPRFTDGPAYRLQRMDHLLERADLDSNREVVAKMRQDRIAHVRQFEEVSGGISLAGGAGGELTEID